WSYECRRASCHRTVQDVAASAPQRVRLIIHRKVGRVPARVGKRVIQCALIGDAEAPAQRNLAVAQHIPGKPNAGTEVIMIPFAQGPGWRKTSRTALPSKNPPLVPRTRSVGALNLPCARR